MVGLKVGRVLRALTSEQQTTRFRRKLLIAVISQPGFFKFKKAYETQKVITTPASDQPETHPQKRPEKRHEGERILARKLRWTKLALFFENFWLKLWLPAAVVALFVIASLFELWPQLSPLAHRLVLALFLFALIGALVPLLSLRWPREAEALKRLDRNSTLPHQPAQAFKDNLDPIMAEGEDGTTRTLWLQFKERLVEKIRQLRVAPPQPETAGKDPFALRMLLLLLIAIGLFIQGGNFSPLLKKALALPPMTDTASLRIDAWVTPPDYTGQPPILIADGGRKLGETREKKKTAFTVPENSILTIRVNGKNARRVDVKSDNEQQDLAGQSAKPSVLSSSSSNAGKDPAQMNSEDKTPATAERVAAPKTAAKSNRKTKEFRLKLTKPGPLQLTLDEIPLADWAFTIKDDMPPVIGLVEMPVRAQSGALKLKYRVADDYGVIGAKARIENVTFEGVEITPETDEERRPLGSPPEYPLNLPQLGTKEGEGETFKDLTGHPWAGLAAELHLIAEDEGGNKSRSPLIKLVLPEINFTKPMAKAIIEIRKQLIVTPHENRLVARALNALTSYTKPFEKDLSLYVGLRFAANRLENVETRDEKEQMAELLYDLARHVEDGDLSKAERELRTAQEELRKALEENAPDSEIEKKIEALRQALQKYMQALAKQQQNQNAQNNQNNQQNQNSQNIDPKDFEQMLKTIEELAKSGSKDLARQMLSQMQNMLENIETGKNGNQQQQNQSAKDLEELGKILRQQQQLMDQTFQQRRQGDQQRRQQQGQRQGQQQQQQGQQGQQQRGQKGQRGQQQGGKPSLEQQQQALQQQLERLMEQMRRQQGRGQQQGQGDQQSLENARDAMGRAQQQLRGNNLSDALSQEGQALDQLRKGMEQMAREMQQGKPGQGGGQRTGGRDPLGRPGSPSGLDTSESTKVPDQIEIQRAREILRNLQEKLSDPNRPAPEIDYFERLLKRF